MKIKHRKRKPVRRVAGRAYMVATSGNEADIVVYWTGSVHEPSQKFNIVVDVKWKTPQSPRDIAESEPHVDAFIGKLLGATPGKLKSIEVAEESQVDSIIDKGLRGEII